MITDLLTQARALISDPAHWLQGTSAAYADGTECGHEDPDAVCFCLEAALDRVIIGQPWKIRNVVWDAVRNATDYDALFEYNDTHSHAEVLALLDRAIERQAQV